MVPAVLLAVISEMAGVAALVVGADRRNDGPMAKKPRGLVFGAIALALALGPPPIVWLDAVLAAMLPLLVLTVGIRVGKALKQVS